MKLAFCLYKYFPYGGLQRDFLAVAKECVKRGHQVRVYTWSWQGERQAAFNYVDVPVTALSNHRKQQQYSQFVQADLNTNSVDLVIGFNRMPGLDVYFAADNCYAAGKRSAGWLTRLNPRYRHFMDYEAQLFSEKNNTHVLAISERQIADFQRFYNMPRERFSLLPPGIDRSRIAPDNASELRQQLRELLGVGQDEYLLLAVGSGFKTKGLDRTIMALSQLNETIAHRCKLFIAGRDKVSNYLQLARRLKIENKVVFLGPRDDIVNLLLASDLLVHPARNEAGGMVLLEAALSGLPVLASEVCGFAHYVRQFDFGQLLAEPFCPDELVEKIQVMLVSEKRSQWINNGLAMSKQPIFDLPEKACDVIESLKA